MAEDDQRNRSVKALRILAYVLVVLILLGVIWLIVSGPKRTLPFLNLSARAERAEMRRKTHAFSIDSTEGKIEVLDIRTGSEFLRLITMPNGTTIAAALTNELAIWISSTIPMGPATPFTMAIAALEPITATISGETTISDYLRPKPCVS